VQVLIGDTLRVLFLWVFHDWRPSLVFCLSSLRGLLPFGSKLFASGLLNTVFSEIYSLVIGRIYTPTTLGLYSRAKQMQQLPVDNLSGIVGRVAFPVFASVQQDKAQLKRGLQKAIKGLVLINFPIMAGLAATAHPLVLALLTKKWEACAPYIQLLCVGGALYPLSLIHLNALQAQGRSDLFLRLEVIKKIVLASTVCITFRYGVKGLLVGDIFVSTLATWLNSHYAVRLVNYSRKEQVLDLLPYAAISALMGTGVWLIGHVAWGTSYLQLGVQIVSGLTLYALGCRLFRPAAFSEACEAVISRIPRWNPA